MKLRSVATTVLTSALLAATGLAHAASRSELPQHPPVHQSMAQARVISSEAIYQTIKEPQTECWTESVEVGRRHRHEANGGAVIGAITGGLIGSAFGKGHGKVAAVAVGAATGAVIGDRADRRYSEEARTVERCETNENSRQVISGYDVRYRYQGQDYSTRLPYDPGRFVRLNVSFAIADEQQTEHWEDNRPERHGRDER